MQTVTMVEFRQNSDEIIQRAMQGQRMILTHRGKPVMRLEPISADKPDKDDPFYALADLADSKGEPLTNEQMDDIIYGK